MTPEGIDIDKLQNELSLVHGAAGIHDLHVWQLGNGTHVGTLHVECNENVNFMDLAVELKKILHGVALFVSFPSHFTLTTDITFT